MVISPDSQAIILLTSRLNLSDLDELSVLTLGEWSRTETKLEESDLRPGDLLGIGAAEIHKLMPGSSLAEGERLAQLLERGTALAFEMERLSSLGIDVMTKADDLYPQRYLDKLKEKAPPVIFFSGDRDLPGQPGVAVVGSRNVSEHGAAFAELIGNYCAQAGLVVYSGGARGVDSQSMKAALEGRGTSVGIMAHSLEKAVRDRDYRQALEKGDLTLMTPYAPNAGFNVGHAMARNKLIYALADYAVVIASDLEKGGTWAGAVEALKNQYTPVFVVDADDSPEGNRELLTKGGIALPDPAPFNEKVMRDWFDQKVEENKPSTSASQPPLF